MAEVGIGALVYSFGWLTIAAMMPGMEAFSREYFGLSVGVVMVAAGSVIGAS